MFREERMRVIDINTFVNSFKVKPNNTMSFLLGAGTSVSSGIMSGGQMVWDFKRSIFCTEKNLKTDLYADLSKEQRQKEIQSYFDSKGGFPSLWTPEEYSFYFEKCYPSRRDREYYIQGKVRDVKPSLGYLCLGELIINGKVNLVSTTNFDDLVQAGIHEINAGISVKTISSATSSSVGFSLTDGFPNIVKLHGDYLFDKLKNTTDELQSLEEKISDIWKSGISDKGLIVIGYAGNDNSIMKALEDLINANQVKKGVYWCQPEGVTLSSRAKAFMEKACSKNEESTIVEISDFDGLMYKLFMSMNLQNSQIDTLWKHCDKRQDILYEDIGEYRATVVTNALPALQYPRKCYVFNSDIKSWKELRETVNEFCTAILYKRRVWAIGSKTEIMKSFSGKINGEIEELSISQYMMQLEDSDVLGMFYSIIDKQLVKRGLLSCGNDRVYDPKSKNYKNGHNLYDAVKMSFSFVKGNLVLNILPTVHALRIDGTELNKLDYQNVVNKEISVLYNRNVNEKIDEWINRLTYKKRIFFELGNAILEFNSIRIRFAGSGMINKCYQAKEPEMVFDYEDKKSSINQLKGLFNYGPIEKYPNRSIRLAVLTPKECARDIWEHLIKLQAYHITTLKQDASFLPEYTGFQNVFRCGLDIPNGTDNTRFKGYELKKALEVDPKKYFDVICQYIDRFERNITEFDVLVIYIPDQLSKMRELKNDS
jgi:hypothetical protein